MKQLKTKSSISLYIDEVKKNEDGTFSVFWKYHNFDTRRLEVNNEDSYLHVRKGAALMFPSNPPTVFLPGEHSCNFETIITEDTELIWKVKKVVKVLSFKECSKNYEENLAMN